MGTLHIYFFILSNLKDIIYFYIVFEIVEAPTYIFLYYVKKRVFTFYRACKAQKKKRIYNYEKFSRHNSNSTFLTCLALM